MTLLLPAFISARFAAVDGCLVARVPAGLSFEEAASVPLAGLTAMESLLECLACPISTPAARR